MSISFSVNLDKRKSKAILVDQCVKKEEKNIAVVDVCIVLV